MVASISIGQRVQKSSQHPHGWKIVDSIPKDDVCVVYLGGDGAQEDRLANGYAKIVENEISEALPEPINYYSVKYNFAGHSKEIARKLSFLKHRATALASKSTRYYIEVQASEYTLDPQYIKNLYQAVIAPRLTDDNRQRLSAEEAARNIRKLTFVAHCHGGYVAHALEKKLRLQLKELGYSLPERKLITSQMLVVAHAPSCPLGMQQSSFYSFRSAYDAEAETGWNLLPEYIRKRKDEERRRFHGEQIQDSEKIAQNRWFDLPAAYLEKKRLFLIKQKHPWLNDKDGPFVVNPAEHGDIQCGSKGQTDDGTMMMLLSRNVTLSGVINSLQQKEKFVPLPPIQELILENGVDMDLSEKKRMNTKITEIFGRLKNSGKALISEVITDYMQSVRSGRS